MEPSATNTSTLHFEGGAGTVTGANFLLESKGAKILIDCGLEQGSSFAEASNYAPFSYAPESIDVLLVTHAHMDHIGRIPKLVHDGFKGKIISTEATRALAEPMLHDALELLTHAAKTHHKEVLYEAEDIAHAFRVWETVSYHEKISLPDGFEAECRDAGHILGSAMIAITRASRTIIFTGDVGNDHSRLVGPTETIAGCQYLVMESVYGDRVQEGIAERVEHLEDTIESTLARGGTLIIPAFSTERTQELLFEIRNLLAEKRVPSVPVYLDSPLASKITDAFLAHPQYFKADIAKRIEGGENIFAFPELHFVHSGEESEALHRDAAPKIILAGSGMSAGGRVLSHEQFYLPDAKNTLLIVGYQSAGSLGRMLAEGVKDITIEGERVHVRAHIEENYGFSAHRDREGLSALVHEGIDSLQHVYVTMGEPKASLYQVQHIRDYMGLHADAPEGGSSVELSL